LSPTSTRDRYHHCIICFSDYLATPAPVATTPDEINKTDDIEENSLLQDNTEIIEDEPSGSGHDTEDEIRRLNY
jgi:hypothetical protein